MKPPEVTDEQIRAAYRDGLISYDLLEFATYPAWKATQSYYREQCAEILSVHSRGHAVRGEQPSELLNLGNLLRDLVSVNHEMSSTVARQLLHVRDRLLALSRTTSEALPHPSGGVGADDHHGGLSQLLGQRTCQPSALPKQDVAVEVLGGEDLDDVGVLQLPGPESSSLGEGGADELGARQVHQGAVHNRCADPLAGLVRQVRADVEPHGASGAVVVGHEESLNGLKARGKYRSNHCYLYFEIERKQRAVAIETSWLPDLHLVRDVLVPLGFTRQPRGAWRASTPIDDFVGVARRVTRALELLLTEALQLIEQAE